MFFLEQKEMPGSPRFGRDSGGCFVGGAEYFLNPLSLFNTSHLKVQDETKGKKKVSGKKVVTLVEPVNDLKIKDVGSEPVQWSQHLVVRTLSDAMYIMKLRGKYDGTHLQEARVRDVDIILPPKDNHNAYADPSIDWGTIATRPFEVIDGLHEEELSNQLSGALKEIGTKEKYRD